jgi:TPR repeat protein
MLGNIALEEGNETDAVVNYRRAIEHGSRAAMYNYANKILEKAGNFKLAKEYYIKGAFSKGEEYMLETSSSGQYSLVEIETYFERALNDLL